MWNLIQIGGKAPAYPGKLSSNWIQQYRVSTDQHRVSTVSVQCQHRASTEQHRVSTESVQSVQISTESVQSVQSSTESVQISTESVQSVKSSTESVQSSTESVQSVQISTESAHISTESAQRQYKVSTESLYHTVRQTSMRKSPILRPALQATPPSSTDSRYCSAGKAGVGVNSSIGVWAKGRERAGGREGEKEIRRRGKRWGASLEMKAGWEIVGVHSILTTLLYSVPQKPNPSFLPHSTVLISEEMCKAPSSSALLSSMPKCTSV